MILLEVKKLIKFYGKFKALDNIDFKIKIGQIVGYLGPNGSGKTTTIKILAGLLTNYNGEIIYKNKNIKSIGYLKEVRFIFDNQNFYENLSAYENLQIISRYNGLYSKKKIYQSLEKVGLEKWINTQVKKFSRGMKQRLAIAIAELNVPELLILDEPTNGLDIEGIFELEGYFLDLNRNYGTTIILSSHYLEQVERLSDHIIIINKGKKIFDDDIFNFRKNSRIGCSYILKDNIDNIEKILNKDILIKLANDIYDENNGKINLSKNDFLEYINKNLKIEYERNKICLIFDRDFNIFEDNFLHYLNSKIFDKFKNIFLYIEPIKKSLDKFFIDEVEEFNKNLN